MEKIGDGIVPGRIKGAVHALILPLLLVAAVHLMAGVAYIAVVAGLYNLYFGDNKEEARNTFNVFASLLILMAISGIAGI